MDQAGIDNRCPVCGWPMSDSAEQGCVPGNCSLRPRPNPTYEEQVRKGAARAQWDRFLASKAEGDEMMSGLGREVARLIAQRDAALAACKRALRAMGNEGNRTGWPAGMLMEYADAINELRDVLGEGDDER